MCVHVHLFLFLRGACLHQHRVSRRERIYCKAALIDKWGEWTNQGPSANPDRQKKQVSEWVRGLRAVQLLFHEKRSVKRELQAGVATCIWKLLFRRTFRLLPCQTVQLYGQHNLTAKSKELVQINDLVCVFKLFKTRISHDIQNSLRKLEKSWSKQQNTKLLRI